MKYTRQQYLLQTLHSLINVQISNRTRNPKMYAKLTAQFEDILEEIEDDDENYILNFKVYKENSLLAECIRHMAIEEHRFANDPSTHEQSYKMCLLKKYLSLLLPVAAVELDCAVQLYALADNYPTTVNRLMRRAAYSTMLTPILGAMVQRGSFDVNQADFLYLAIYMEATEVLEKFYKEDNVDMSLEVHEEALRMAIQLNDLSSVEYIMANAHFNINTHRYHTSHMQSAVNMAANRRSYLKDKLSTASAIIRKMVAIDRFEVCHVRMAVGGDSLGEARGVKIVMGEEEFDMQRVVLGGDSLY